MPQEELDLLEFAARQVAIRAVRFDEQLAGARARKHVVLKQPIEQL